MLCSCDPLYREYTPFRFINDSDIWVCFTSPYEKFNYHHIKADTTMMSYYEYVWVQSLANNCQSRVYHNSLDRFEEWVPQNTNYYSMFVFKHDLDDEIYAGVEFDDYWRAKFSSDEYYVRYDLTIDDIHSLCDSNGVLVISYPPDERMKNIKMWPPYDEVIK